MRPPPNTIFMACEICGRNACTRSFHDLDEQKNFDDVADNVKERMRNSLKREMGSLPCYDYDDKDLVNLSDVIKAIESYY